MASRARRIVVWTFLALLVMIVGCGIALCAISGNLIRSMAGHKGSAALGRQLSIDGPVKVDWDWTTPDIHISQIHLSNLPDSKDPNMVDIDQLNFHIKIWKLLEGQLNLPDIEVIKPRIVLEKRDATTRNWDFPTLSKASAATSAALPSKRSNVPILGSLAIEQGTLIYHDMTKNIDLKLDIDNGKGGGGEKGDFVVSGQGTLQGQPFNIAAQAGSLGMLRDSTKAYPLNLSLKMGPTTLLVNGTFNDPIKLEGVDATLKITGDNLADLYYLTMLPLPPSPHYELSGHLTKNGGIWQFADFKGKVGGSDLEGNLSYDTSKTRGYAKADLTSRLLDVKDLGGLIGIKPKSPGEPDAAKTETSNNDTDRILPDVPLDLSRLRATDMDVTLKAEQILLPGMPMNDLDIGFHLKDGDLVLDPFKFGIASGDISGTIDLDGRTDIPHVRADLAITRLSLKQFFGKTQFAPEASGFIGGHFDVAGAGKSLAAVLADSNGRVTAVMSGGTISQLVVDAAGLDVGHAIGDLVGKDAATGVRCMVADFKDSDGLLNSNAFVLDTAESHIGGEAHISLKDETIDAHIRAEPKSLTVTAHAPITISGHLKHPGIGVDPAEPAGRGAAAAVLSVFLTPLAAVIPFIETGVGKDSDCAGLIQQAREHAAAAAGKQQTAAPTPATTAPN